MHDACFPTSQALEALGFKSAPPVSHAKGFRTEQRKSRFGWHTNDAESENARCKGQQRSRDGKIVTRNWGPGRDGELWMLRTNFPAMTCHGVLELCAPEERRLAAVREFQQNRLSVMPCFPSANLAVTLF